MKVTTDLILPSLEYVKSDSCSIKEKLQIIVANILETQYVKRNILLNVGDQLFISDLKDTPYPVLLVVSQRMFDMSFVEEKEGSVHFVMTELG